MLSAYECETIINYNMSDQNATVYTHDKKLIKRLEKLSAKFPEEFVLTSKSHWGDVTYTFPKKYITIRNHTVKQDGRLPGNVLYLAI